MSKAAEFRKNKVDSNLYYSHEVDILMESYHKSRVNAISDEDIMKGFELKLPYSEESNNFYSGIKWFKEQLLKQ